MTNEHQPESLRAVLRFVAQRLLELLACPNRVVGCQTNEPRVYFGLPRGFGQQFGPLSEELAVLFFARRADNYDEAGVLRCGRGSASTQREEQDRASTKQDRPLPLRCRRAAPHAAGFHLDRCEHAGIIGRHHEVATSE